MFSVPSKSELLLVACPPSLSHQLQCFLGHAHTIFRFTSWSNRCTMCRGLRKLSLDQELACTSRKTARDCIVGHTGMCMSVQSGLNGDSGNSSDVADLPHTHSRHQRVRMFFSCAAHQEVWLWNYVITETVAPRLQSHVPAGSGIDPYEESGWCFVEACARSHVWPGSSLFPPCGLRKMGP